jgi:hypothetical protein
MVKEEDFYTMEKGAIFFFHRPKDDAEEVTSNERDWTLNRLSNSSSDYIRRNFLLLNLLLKLELKERKILNHLKRLNICRKSR